MTHDRHKEGAFETVIESHLLANGYVSVDKSGFDATRTVFPDAVVSFIRQTQPKEWAKLDGLRAATERTIALLKERRAALIAAAVTGKIDLQEVRCQTSTVAQERRPPRCV